MATLSGVPALVAIEEYLTSSYEPDLEFVDGVLEEKNKGEWGHGFLQAAISAWFFNHRAEWKVNVAPLIRRMGRGSQLSLDSTFF